MNSYSKKRYQEDPEYREKRKNQAKIDGDVKISGELSNGCIHQVLMLVVKFNRIKSF